MARPPSVRQLAEDAKQALGMLSTFVREVADGLSANLTVRENLAAQWVTMEFTSAVATAGTRVASLKNRPVKAVLLGGYSVITGVVPTVALAHSWTAQGDNLRVTLVTPLSAGDRLQLTFLVLPE